MNVLELSATSAEVLSLIALVISLVQAKNAIKLGNTEEAHRAATNLLLDYYDVKKKSSESSFKKKISNEVDAYRVLFIAESIFVMMKNSSRRDEWLTTVEFLLHEVDMLAGYALPIETYDSDFAKLVVKVLGTGNSNY